MCLYPKKYKTDHLHCWWRHSLCPKEETIPFWKKISRDKGVSVCVCVWGGSKFGPNDKRHENIFRMTITPNRCELDMWLPLDTNRKSYMGSPTAPLHLTLSDLEWMVKVKVSQILKAYISQRSLVSPMLLLAINRKPYMGSVMTPWHLTLSDLERSKPYLKPYIS